jgi:RpiR family carbohydrate utilization transcriptional regulator
LKRSPQRRRTPQSAKGPSKPSHPQALIPFLQGLLPTLKRARRRIAEAIIRDPEDFIAHSIAELAAGARVSPGSIVMFCQSLGLKGLPALKMALARELSEPLFVSRDPIRNQDSDATTLQKVFDEHIRALQETLRINSAETLRNAVRALSQARRISLFATGLSYPVAYSLCARLRLIGFPAHAEYDSHLQLAAAADMRSGEVAIGISVAGNTRETVECLRLARSRGARTICITNSIDSLLAQAADIRLYGAPSEVKYFQAPLASRVTQLAIADALLVELGIRYKRQALAHLRRAEEHLLQRRLTGLGNLKNPARLSRPRPQHHRGLRPVHEYKNRPG